MYNEPMCLQYAGVMHGWEKDTSFPATTAAIEDLLNIQEINLYLSSRISNHGLGNAFTRD